MKLHPQLDVGEIVLTMENCVKCGEELCERCERLLEILRQGWEEVEVEDDILTRDVV